MAKIFRNFLVYLLLDFNRGHGLPPKKRGGNLIEEKREYEQFQS